MYVDSILIHSICYVTEVTKLLLPHLFTNSSDNKHQHGHLGYDSAVMTTQEHFLPHGSQIHIPSLPPPSTNINRHVSK